MWSRPPGPDVKTWRLEGIGHDRWIEVPVGRPVTVGRAPESDTPIGEVTVSRRHAVLEASPGGIRVRDLGSANGTAINGARVADGTALPGDTVTFGAVAFRVAGEEPGSAALAPGAVVRSLPRVGEDNVVDVPAIRLGRVLDLAKRLSGEFELDKLIGAIVALTFDLLPADRVALSLVEPASGELLPVLTRSRVGDPEAVRVPRSIADRAVAHRQPILTENALADERFRSGSVVLQAVRGAICVPLLASSDQVLGILYVDTLTSPEPFSDDDARLLFAFGGLAAVAISKVRLAEEVRRDNEVRANFERFFAPEVAARIVREHGSIGPGGERRRVTALFSDVRRFTTIAETMPPEDLAALLTEYFTEMVEVVFAHGGTVDKFIGDALLAVWGAPLSAPDDPDRAVRAALAMRDRLVLLNRRWQASGRPALAIGIGISTGQVFAGYLGSERRLEYSVIGDAVNVASRLADEAGPGDILLDAATRDLLAATTPLDPLPQLTLRNRAQAVQAYRLTPTPDA